jgi:hypothetical protein
METKTMAKKPIPVNRGELEKAVKVAESENKFPNLSALYEDVAKRYNMAVNPAKPLTAGVVGLRIKEWKIQVETKPGKRGGGSGSHLRGPRGPRTSKAEKFKGDPAMIAAIDEMRRTTPERFLPVVDQIAAGSRTAGVKLRCLDCAAWQTPEVRNCPVTACGLWPFRPYQGATTAEEQVEPVEEAEAA